MRIFGPEANDLDDFLNLPQSIRRDPNRIWTSIAGQKKQLRADSPFWLQRQGQFFLQSEPGQWARCAAFFDPLIPNQKTMIGFFEAQTSEAGGAVLQAAQAWLKKQGQDHVYGPMNGSTWHTYRFRLSSPGRSPFLLEPHQPDWYPQVWKNQGWVVDQAYNSAEFQSHDWLPEDRMLDLQRYYSAGYSFRFADLKNWASELKILYQLSCEIFQNNHAFIPITEPEFIDMYGSAKALVKSENLIFSLNTKGQEVGFLFTLPNLTKKVQQLGPEPGFWQYLKFALTSGKSNTIIFKTVGVTPVMRRVRVGSSLMTYGEQVFLKRGFTKAIHALMSSDNLSQTFAGDKGTVIGEYQLLRKDL